MVAKKDNPAVLKQRLHALEVAASALMDALSNHYKGRRSGACPTDEIEQAWNALWVARWRNQ